VWFGTGLLLLFVGFEAQALIYALIAGWAVKCLTGWILSSTSLGRPTLDYAYSLIEFSKYNSVSYIQGEFYSWMDIAIIGLFLGQAQVGVYEIVWRVAQAVLMVSSAISIAILPQVSKWDHEGKWKQIEKLVSNTITPAVFLVIPAFVGLFLISDSLLGELFGRNFMVGSPVLMILLGERVFHAVFLVFRGSLLGMDHPGLVARAIIMTLIINFVLNILLVRIYRINRVAFGIVISFLFCTALHWKYLSRFIRVKTPYYEIGWCIISSTGMVVSLTTLRPMLPSDSLIKLIGNILFGA